MLAPARVLIAAVLTTQIIMPLHAREQYKASDDQRISQGREIWLNNCETCHGYGIADAPIPMNPEE